MDFGERSGGDAAEPSPLALAMDALMTDLRGLVKLLDDQVLDATEPAGQVGFAQEVERFRNVLAVVDHRIVAALDGSRAAERFGQRSVARVLVQALRISPGEAARRVAAAEAVGPRRSMLGDQVDPVRPVLAAAQAAGEVSAEQVAIIVKALAGVDRRGFDPADIAAGEHILTQAATQLGPPELARLAVRVVDGIDPDGTLPDEDLQQDRRSFELRKGRDGSWRGEFRLTGPCGAKLAAILGPLARPVLPPPGEEKARLLADERSYPQRMHDALETVCDRILRGDLPDAGGTPATVIITIAGEDLAGGAGHGTTSDGTVLSVLQVREVANNADVWLARLTPAGAVVNLGRTRRIASRAQTVALIARDGGCSFPGCDIQAEWCERHHIREWIEGGPTDLDNLTLLCRHHHRHFERNGWQCRLNHDRLPEWIPPKWVDKHQRPRVNSRIHLIHGRLIA